MLRPRAPDCMAAMARARALIMSAGTLTEAMIVARRRGFGAELDELVADFQIDIQPVTAAVARRAAAAYDRWGKGVHPAALNFGDCFAYEVAEANACPLLFVGNDFAQTDVRAAL